ncbi:DUF551 domain-containing protein [Klebsiella pneumoniae]
MTSKLTREERVQALYDLKVGQVLSLADIENVKMLSRMALAAMDSEPVKRVNADQMHHVCLEANRHLDKYGAMAKEVNKLLGRIPAHPAPVVQCVPLGDSPYDVPCSMPSNLREFIDQEIGILFSDDDAQGVWIACRRAAMLQELQKSAGAEATCRSNKNVQDMQVDNSLAIPDGYVMVPVEPNGDMLAAAQDAYGETDGDIASTLRAAMLAAAPQSPGSDPATVPGKWIPVSERIPDNTEPVLCIEKRADFGTYGQPFVCWHDGGGWVGKTNYRPIVTHWMPLPAAPREVE